MKQNLQCGVAELYGTLTEYSYSFREDILRLTLIGLAQSEIAEKVGASVEEVKCEQDRIYRQADVKDRAGLFRRLVELVF